jgi:hypothetical protein
MGFYHFSFLGTALVLALGLGSAGAFWLVWRGVLKRNISGKVFVASLPLFLLLPCSEELWIAYNFDRHCRQDAGIFVYKTVEVEGFFSVSGAQLDLVRPGGYRFIESYSEKKGQGSTPRTIRLEFGDAAFARKAIEKYEREFRPQKAADKDVLRVDLDASTEALVYPKSGESWRITTIDHPSARYRYLWPHVDTPMSHKVDKIERVVSDSQTGDLLARETRYRRQAPWFYVGLDRPVMLCPAPGAHPLSKYGSVFTLALKPKQD